MNTTTTAPRLTRTAAAAASTTRSGDETEKPQSPELTALRTLYATATRQHYETRQDLAAITEKLAEIMTQLEQMQTTAAAPPTPSANAPAATGEHFIAHRVELELLKKPGESKSRRYFKVVGEAPYHNHGARVWPEVLEQIGIDPDALTIDDPHHLTPGTIAHITKNPLKVTRLETPTR